MVPGETVAVEGAARAPRRPDPASLPREQRAAQQRLQWPLNYQRDSGARSSRAAMKSHRAGTGTPLLEIITGASSSCFETRHGGDTGWCKETPSCPGLPGRSCGAGGGAGGERGQWDTAQGHQGHGTGTSRRRGMTNTAQGDHQHGTGGSQTPHWSGAFVDMMPGTHKSHLIIP